LGEYVQKHRLQILFGDDRKVGDATSAAPTVYDSNFCYLDIPDDLSVLLSNELDLHLIIDKKLIIKTFKSQMVKFVMQRQEKLHYFPPKT
jgi:hypothetical protein